jgi:hypothetical protein
MMIYDIAVVEDQGTYWKINNLVQNTMENLANSTEKTLRLSYMANELIKEAMLSGKVVHVPKENLRSVEVLPGDFTIIEPSEEDKLQATKDAVNARVRMLITPTLTKISGITLYGFMVLNNDLANAGYFITNENREEKYLEILETGDEKLIAKLEDYLNYKDEIESVAFLERDFSAFRKEVKQSNSVDEVVKLQDDFLEKMKTRLK